MERDSYMFRNVVVERVPVRPEHILFVFYAKNASERSWVRISVGANNYFSQKIHQKRKIDAKSSKINCNCHRKIEYDYLR
jgi:hypothetical protein